VEVWFGISDRQAIRRGGFTSVKDLNAKFRQFITGWNDRKHPFVWPEFHKLTSFLAASLGSLQVTSLSMWRAGH